MNQTDQRKLCDAGFKIIRSREFYPGSSLKPVLGIVYKAAGVYEWRTLEKGFKSKAARDRRIAELLKDPKIIME